MAIKKYDDQLVSGAAVRDDKGRIISKTYAPIDGTIKKITENITAYEIEDGIAQFDLTGDKIFTININGEDTIYRPKTGTLIIKTNNNNIIMIGQYYYIFNYNLSTENWKEPINLNQECYTKDEIDSIIEENVNKTLAAIIGEVE